MANKKEIISYFFQDNNGEELTKQLDTFFEKEKVQRDKIISISYAVECAWMGGYKHNALVVIEKQG